MTKPVARASLARTSNPTPQRLLCDLIGDLTKVGPSEPCFRAANSCGSGSTDRYFITRSQTGVWLSFRVCRCECMFWILFRVAAIESLLSEASTAISRYRHDKAAEELGCRLQRLALASTKYLSRFDAVTIPLHVARLCPLL